MPIPDFQSVMRPVLTTVQNGAPLPLSELRERIADQFQLTEEERKEHLPSGHQTVINNRVGWGPELISTRQGYSPFPPRAWCKSPHVASMPCPMDPRASP